MKSSWELKRLGDCCLKIGSGATPSGGKESYLDSGEYRLIRSQNIYNDGFSEQGLAFINEEQAKKLNNVSVEEDDVLLNITGDSVARVCQALAAFLPARVNQHVAIIRPKPNELDSTFLRYFLASPKQQNVMLKLAGAGATRNALTKGMIESFEILCPSVEEQKQIAHVLKLLDERINLLGKTNQTLKEISQVIFKNTFTNFTVLPDEWKKSCLGEVSNVGIGKTPPRKETEWFSCDNQDVKWLSIRDMGLCGVYALESAEYLTVEAINKFNVKLVPKNTVLMSFKLTVGRLAITSEEMATNEAIAHFKIDENSPLTSEFIYLYLSQFNFNTLASTSSIADAVNSNSVREIPVFIPPEQLLRTFQANVEPMFRKIHNNEQLARTLTRTRNALLPRLISGKLSLLSNKRE